MYTCAAHSPPEPCACEEAALLLLLLLLAVVSAAVVQRSLHLTLRTRDVGGNGCTRRRPDANRVGGWGGEWKESVHACMCTRVCVCVCAWECETHFVSKTQPLLYTHTRGHTTPNRAAVHSTFSKAMSS